MTSCNQTTFPSILCSNGQLRGHWRSRKNVSSHFQVEFLLPAGMLDRSNLLNTLSENRLLVKCEAGASVCDGWEESVKTFAAMAELSNQICC